MDFLGGASELEVDVKVQQELLRHADIRTTMDVYTQAVSEQNRTAHSSVVRMVRPSWVEAARRDIHVSVRKLLGIRSDYHVRID